MRYLAFLFFLLLPLSAEAQQPAPAADSSSQNLLKPGELDALVAPIALYPDPLLAQVMMAAGYPLEVVEAERWAAANKGLTGDALKAAVEKMPWDESVKSLIAKPSVLALMSKRLDWTQKLGDAVLAQEPDVMDSVQRLRMKAQASDTLKSTKEQNVTVRQDGGRQIVAIEPTDPGTVFVPFYDPNIVFGTWPYPDYPPYYYPDDWYLPGAIIGTGLAFGAGYALWRWANGGHWWGNINWNKNNIDINRGNRVEQWRHNPAHRRGVAYNNPNVRQQFAGAATRPPGKGLDGRGRDGKQVVNPKAGGKQAGGPKGGGKQAGGPKAGSKQAGGPKGGGKQAGAKQRPAQKTAQGKRPAQGKQAQARRSTPQRSAQRPQQRASQAQRGGGQRSVARVSRQQSFAPRGGGGRSFGGGGRGGGRGGGGGRRSDIRVKHDIALLGHLENGIGWYRFAYVGGTRTYVGVMAQEVQRIAPEAVVRDPDGILRVDYDKLGVKFQPYNQWLASGAQIPGAARIYRRAH